MGRRAERYVKTGYSIHFPGLSDWIDTSAFNGSGDLIKEIGFYGWVGETSFLLHMFVRSACGSSKWRHVIVGSLYERTGGSSR